MKINEPNAATNAEQKEAQSPFIRPPSVRLHTPASRLAAAGAAGAAVACSTVSLAFFLSRRPTPAADRHHAKFRA